MKVERRAKLDFGEELVTSFREYDFKVQPFEIITVQWLHSGLTFCCASHCVLVPYFKCLFVNSAWS